MDLEIEFRDGVSFRRQLEGALRVAAPDPAVLKSVGLTRARPSIVKIEGTAPSCSRRIEGSGFVFARHHVLTTTPNPAQPDNHQWNTPAARRDHSPRPAQPSTTPIQNQRVSSLRSVDRG